VCCRPAPSDPHHVGRRGVGQKTDDYRTVPLCRRCHDEFHATGMLRGVGGVREHFFRKQIDLLVEWISGEELAFGVAEANEAPAGARERG
jgi:hypothetical protein